MNNFSRSSFKVLNSSSSFYITFFLFASYFILATNAGGWFGGGGGGGNVNNEELYKRLGVSKTATTKEIRVAFKKLALEKHPDKNKDDPNANENFIKINRAYEILKDEETRKKYDQFGEEGLKDSGAGSNYQSWNFYNSNFGIYDDDPEVITLSRSDFSQAVEGSDTIWFINFYSAQCSHCHDLAPTWRELAKQLSGVVKIGAVNCMDDWMLCNEQFIQAFPSLIIYPRKEKFIEEKSLENLLKFSLKFTNDKVHELNTYESYVSQLKGNEIEQKPWFISYCLANDDSNQSNDEHDNELNYELNCLEESIQRKLAIMLDGLVNVGTISCEKKEAKERICSRLKPKRSSPLVLYERLPNITKADNEQQLIVNSKEIHTTDYKQIAQFILSSLPSIKELDQNEFKTILENLRDKTKDEKPLLIQFVYTYDTINDIELKKLPHLLAPNYNFARVDCSKMTQNECSKYQLAKYPTYVLFKSASTILGDVKMKDNWYDIHYGNRQSPEDLKAFVKENANAPTRCLTELDLNSLNENLMEENKQGFFVDFFAPWCPPCLNLLPEFRKASKLDITRSISFGTVDCTANQNLCAQHGIRSYPTTIFYNNSVPHSYTGQHKAVDLADFIQDVLKPVVVQLDGKKFKEMVANKPKGKIWFITFSASWCGPCQQLAPEWRKFAKKLDPKVASIGTVDCAAEQNLCIEQQVSSYPNIRVYPSDSHGVSNYEMFQGWMRDANSLYQWAANYLPSNAMSLDYKKFEKLVIKQGTKEKKPWIVTFSSPWCGHCHTFAPIFEEVAGKLESKANFGKVNCQEQQYICQMAGIRAFPTIIFYEIPKSDPSNLNWRHGDELQAYEANTLQKVINSKLKQYGYGKSQTKVDDEL